MSADRLGTWLRSRRRALPPLDSLCRRRLRDRRHVRARPHSRRLRADRCRQLAGRGGAATATPTPHMSALGPTRAGSELPVAGNWPAGLRLLRARHFDLVVLDVMLPGPSGMEALEAIRADPALKGLPVAILSNSDLTPEVHARALDLGILGWLTKSRTPPPMVVRTIRRWLGVMT